MLTYDSFKVSLQQDNVPKGMNPNLQALWLDAKGNWDAAHEIVQSTGGQEGDWIHAYLHRKEGDLANAGYWYARCGKTRSDLSLQEEWERIARHLIEK